MTHEQLNAVVAATGHERYRWLTSAANPDRASREGFRRLVAEKAAALANPEPPVPEHLEPPPPPPLMPLDESLARLRLVRKSGGRRCPYGSPASCGCSGLAACSIHGRDVTTDDCYACLTTGPRSHEIAVDQGASP